MQWLVDRLKEPSSLVSLGTIGGILVSLIPPQYQWIAQLAGAVLAGAGFVVPEKK